MLVWYCNLIATLRIIYHLEAVSLPVLLSNALLISSSNDGGV